MFRIFSLYLQAERFKSDMSEDLTDYHDLPIGKCGFYTDDPVEFEQRVSMIEADLDEVDAGIDDPQKWIQVDDFMAAMRKEHPRLVS